MIRILIFFLFLAVLAWGMSWLADRPGQLEMEWLGYHIEMSVFTALIVLFVAFASVALIWSLLRYMLSVPGGILRRYDRHRHNSGLVSLSRGLVAAGAGDAARASKYARRVANTSVNQPLSILLKAQAAQLSGNAAAARRIYESMLLSPDTELMGLHGLYTEARREHEMEAALQFAEKAAKLDRKLAWPGHALLEIYSRAGQWSEALKALETVRKNGNLDAKSIARQRSVLLAAEAMRTEDSDMDGSLQLALEAHKLANDLVPAADVAGRILASKGETPKAARILAKTWKLSPHPDLALTYSYARPGDSPRDRLKRARKLADMTPHSPEGPIAVATAAVEAREWGEAREVLKPLVGEKPTARVCTLMAQIEGGEFGDKGRVREWLARAVHAPRDPVWIADGYVSDNWLPVSPVTGKVGAFAWKVPDAVLDFRSNASFLENIMHTGEPPEAPATSAITAKTETVAGLESSTAPSVEDAEIIEETSQVEQGKQQQKEAAGQNADASPGNVEQVFAGSTSVHAEETEIQKPTPKPINVQKELKEPEIYVPPHAPDDPGTSGERDEERLPYSQLNKYPA
jgi:HemY protein